LSLAASSIFAVIWLLTKP